MKWRWRDQKTARWYAVIVLVAAFGCLSTTGCHRSARLRYQEQFSPDDSLVAYLEDHSGWELLLGHKTDITHDFSACWTRVETPRKRVTVQLPSPPGDWSYHDDVPNEMKISPDSRYMGVLLPGSLTVIDMLSGQPSTITTGNIGSFSWISSDELAYFRVEVQDSSQLPETAIYRTSVSAPERTGRRVFGSNGAGDVSLHLGGMDRVYWSPDGRYVVFRDGSTRAGGYSIFNFQTATARTLPEQIRLIVHFAWTPDSSAFFCISSRRPYGDSVLFMNPETLESIDFSAEFLQHISLEGQALSFLSTRDWFRWTADGEYLILNRWLPQKSGLLIDLDPWRVLPIADQLNRLLPNESDRMPALEYLPVDGYVGVRTWGPDALARYAVSYDLQRIVELGPGQEKLIYSNSGDTAAAITGRHGKVTLYKFNIPPISP